MPDLAGGIFLNSVEVSQAVRRTATKIKLIDCKKNAGSTFLIWDIISTIYGNVNLGFDEFKLF